MGLHTINNCPSIFTTTYNLQHILNYSQMSWAFKSSGMDIFDIFIASNILRSIINIRDTDNHEQTIP